MTDIITSEAWNCGERDCPAQWHKADYWISETGYTVDRYADGDHEEIEEDEVPTFDKIDESWRRYYADVAETGEDVLGELIVPLTRSRKVKWQVVFSRSILGTTLRSARRNGRGPWVRSIDLPDELIEFLDVRKRRPDSVTHQHDATLDELRALAMDSPDCRVQRPERGFLKMIVTVSESVPIAGYERRMKAAARKAMKCSVPPFGVFQA